MTRLIHYNFYLLLFLTPLTLYPTTFELFEFNKMILVYLLTIVISAAWLTQIIASKKIIFRRTPFDIPILLLLISQILSTIFSIHPHTSLIGYYSRFHGSLYSTLSYTLLFYAFTTFANKSFVKNCLYLLFSSATLVALYAIFQHFGIDAHLWVQDVKRRVFSTLGQPNWLAAFLLVLLPLTWSQALSKKSHTIYYALHALYFLALLYTKSRSGLLGLILTYATFWLLILAKTKFTAFPTKKFLLVTFALLALSLTDGLRWIPTVDNLYSKFSSSSVSTDNRQPTTDTPSDTQLAVGGTESSVIRKIVWKGAIDIWRHYPLFGSGVETFAYSYYNFRPAAHNLVSEWDFLYNKAHNEYLNFLATTGSFGLASYLLLQLWFIFFCLKNIFSQKLKADNQLLTTGLLSGYIGLASSNFFGFSTVTTGLFFFLWPALAVSSIRYTKYHIRYTKPLTPKQIIGISAVILTTSYWLLTTARWWYADTRFAKGKKYLEAGYSTNAFPFLQQATHLMPNEPTFHSELAKAAASLSVSTASSSTESAGLYASLALAELDLTQTLNPVHLNFVKARASALFTLASLNPQFWEDAETSLLYGLSLSPTDAKLYYNLGALYFKLEDNQKALAMLNKAILLKPNYETARLTLAKLHEDLGNTQEAIKHYQYIVDNIATKNPLPAQKLQELIN